MRQDYDYYSEADYGVSRSRKKKKSSPGKVFLLGILFGIAAAVSFTGARLGIKSAEKYLGVSEYIESKDEAQGYGSAVSSEEYIDASSQDHEAGEEGEDLSEGKGAADSSASGTTSGVKQADMSSGYANDEAGNLSDVSDIVAAAESSIVSITTTSTQTVRYFFEQVQQESSSAGSGIVIGQEDGVLYISTNYHVIEGANKISVVFIDGSVADAAVKGYDSDSDVAVLAVSTGELSADALSSITVAKIGDSDELKVGEPAIAIGNALGIGQSVTVGYISALSRAINDYDGAFIQTDAAINPGNSGGALLNKNGEVIGITSSKYVDSSVEGMGFAIPINSAMDIIYDIISGTGSGTAYLGAGGIDIKEEYQRIYGFPQGIYVNEVDEGSPAEMAGIRTGDIITAVDGESVASSEQLSKLIKGKSVGSTVEISIYRAGASGRYSEMSVSAVLGSKG